MEEVLLVVLLATMPVVIEDVVDKEVHVEGSENELDDDDEEAKDVDDVEDDILDEELLLVVGGSDEAVELEPEPETDPETAESSISAVAVDEALDGLLRVVDDVPDAVVVRRSDELEIDDDDDVENKAASDVLDTPDSVFECEVALVEIDEDVMSEVVKLDEPAPLEDVGELDMVVLEDDEAAEKEENIVDKTTVEEEVIEDVVDWLGDVEEA